MSDWQPITTAPNDGTLILTFQANSMTGAKVKLISWRNDTVPNGWSMRENEPTHWMPLPAPPDECERGSAAD